MLSVDPGEYSTNGRGGPHRNGATDVVTGAAGFIGSHLVDLLVGRGRNVIGLDCFDPVYSPEQKRANLVRAIASGWFRLEVGDLRHSNLAELFAGAETVYHLAARAGVQDSWSGAFADTWDVNVAGTQAVLEAALTAGVRRVVIASSSSVYGETSERRGRRILDPVSPYGASKAACEHLASMYANRGLDIVTLRYFTVYGPRQRPDMAMHRIFESLRPDGQAFVRRGSGSQTREFTFVLDAVAATAAAGVLASASNRTFDIGGGARASLNDVIARVGALTGAPVPVEVVARPAGDPQATSADCSAAHRLLGWRPVTSLNRGLAEQWAWHRHRRATGVESAPDSLRLVPVAS
jgi:UDP-glucose 4-epimerase